MKNLCGDNGELLKGVGLGMAVGIGFGILVAPKKRSRANRIGKATKMAGQILEKVL